MLLTLTYTCTLCVFILKHTSLPEYGFSAITSCGSMPRIALCRTCPRYKCKRINDLMSPRNELISCGLYSYSHNEVKTTKYSCLQIMSLTPLV